MIGTRLQKPIENVEDYAVLARWCNENQTATLEEFNDYYEVVAKPEQTDEEKSEQALAQAKAERAEAVASITVEVDGMVFDGDENAQRRMTVAMSTARSKADRINAERKAEWQKQIAELTDGKLVDDSELSAEPEYDNYLDYTTTWVLADSTYTTVTIAQLSEACELAGTKQTELWTKPYEG